MSLTSLKIDFVNHTGRWLCGSNIFISTFIEGKDCCIKKQTSKDLLSAWEIRRTHPKSIGTDILVVSVFRKLTIHYCRCKTINEQSKPLTIGRFLWISTYFWIWRSSRCILLPTLDVAMTDDMYRIPLPASSHKSWLLYLSLSIPDPRGCVKSTFADFSGKIVSLLIASATRARPIDLVDWFEIVEKICKMQKQ